MLSNTVQFPGLMFGLEISLYEIVQARHCVNFLHEDPQPPKITHLSILTFCQSELHGHLNV